MNFKQFLTSNRWILLTGILFGTLGALAVNWGNPANMGICAACFLRDIAGALQLHHNPLVQYIRPEIIGFVLGAFGTSLTVREWRSRGGSSPLLRFVLGAFVMIGVLVFLGCPIRVMLRIAGGDLNGVIALAGLVSGIGIGTFFLRRGFSLGSHTNQNIALGLFMPLMAVGLLILLVSHPPFIAFSATGPGVQHVPWLLGLGLGGLVGGMVQRTRFCSIGAWRDIFLVKDFQLFSGVAAFLIAALFANYVAGNFNPTGLGYHWGFTNQPISLPMTHWAEYIWTFLSLVLVGLAGTFLEGCPLRNLIRAGEGDSDATITILGYLAGAAIAHRVPIASSPAGLGNWASIAVLLGLSFCLGLGFLHIEKTESQTQAQKTIVAADGIITFADVASAMKAEKVIQMAGYEVKLVAPPPELRMGCDLALAISLVQQRGIERLLQDQQLSYAKIMPISKGSTQMCEIVKVTDFGQWMMVKAGNMKLSYEKVTGAIVNISGGGCPDIPYLHAEMVDKPLSQAPHPRDLGYTLCATMLQRAYDESLQLEQGGS